MWHRFVKVITNLTPYLIVAILIVSREPTLFTRAEFHAEDCTEFFITAFDKGFESLFIPIWGYHFFLGRIIAYTASFFPIFWIPSIYIFSALFFSSITLGYFSREGFSWLIKSKFFRILTCILMATGPGNEVYLGLCVMYSPLVLLGLLLLLEQPWGLTWQKILLICFLTFSAGAMFSLIPIIILLMYLTKEKKYLIILLTVFAVSISNTIGTVSSNSLAAQTGLFKISSLLYVPEILIKNFFARLFVIPFFGQLSMDLLRNPVKFIRAVLVFGIFGYYFVKQGLYKDQSFYILMLIYSSFIGVLGVTALIRNSEMGIDILLIKHSTHWDIRYFFLPGAAALLFWSYIISKQIEGNSILNSIVLIYILITINILNWNYGLKRENIDWKIHSAIIQKAVDERDSGVLENPVSISFPVHPKWSCSITVRPSNM